MNHIERIEKELERAKTKHPFFAHEPLPVFWLVYTKQRLRQDRRRLEQAIKDECVSGLDVLYCEISEALDAYAREDREGCIAELAQCAAVIVRIMEGIEEDAKK